MTDRNPSRAAFVAAALAVLLPLGALPAPASAQDLLQAYRDSLANDALLASARQQLAAIRERVPQARAGLLPTVTANANVNRQMVDPSTGPTREFTAQSYNVTANYPLYRAQNLIAYDQSLLTVTLNEAQYAAAEQDLMLRVAQAYFDVLAAQDALAVIQSQKVAISEQLASARRNFEVGTATITDQQEAQARFDLTVAQEIAAENDLAVRRAALSQLTGKPVGILNTLRPGVGISPPQPAREIDWTNNARADNYAVLQAQIASEIARREIDRQRAGHRPTLDVVGQLIHSRNSAINFIGVQTNSALLGLQFSVPLYQGGAIDARVREAISLQDKTMSDLEVARRAAEQGARQAFIGVSSGLAQVRALEAAERSSQLALDSNRLGYQVGVRINIDVLNAQQQLFSTRRDLSKARYDVLVNGLRLKSTAASLREEDLAQINGLLAPPSAR